MNPTKLSVLALSAAVFAVACSDSTAPSRTLVGAGASAAISGHPIEFINGENYPPDPAGGNLIAHGAVVLCKTADAAGSFDFSMTLNGGLSQAIPGGPLVLNAAGTVCRTIHTSTVNNAAVPDLVTVTEAADQANWALTGVDIDQYFGAFTTYPTPRLDSDDDDSPTRGATVYINNDLSKVITFTNDFTPPQNNGCTLTQGYWKNHLADWDHLGDPNTAPFITSTAFFNSGKTYQQVITIEEDGNAYYILGRQFIAALLNIGAGASTTPAVDQALIDAAALFAGWPAGTTGPTNQQGRATWITLAGILDQYNRGLIGPGKCTG